MNDDERQLRIAQSNLITLQAMKIARLEAQLKLLEAVVAELKAAAAAKPDKAQA